MKRSRQIVVDSSVIVKWLSSQDEKWLNQENELFLKEADRLLDDRRRGKIILHTLELVKYEVGNAINYKGMDETATLSVIILFYSLPIIFHQMEEELALDTGELAKKMSITYYDASFLALAKQLKAKLVTDNPKHQKKQKDILVTPIEKYH